MHDGIPILLYHDIESVNLPNEKTGEATRDTVVLKEDFENQIDFLCNHGFQTITLQDYFNSRHNPGLLPPNPIIITFDDGHHSNYHVAFNLLQRKEMLATFFIIVDRIGTSNHVNAAQLKEMAAAGMEIGSHGMTHRYLPLLTKEAIGEELMRSKKDLEALIGKRIDYFAYPGGHYNSYALQVLADAGYTGACSCHLGLNRAGTNRYLMRRVEIRKRVNIEDFNRMIIHRSLRLYQMVDRFKSMLRSAIGLRRYIHLREKLYRFYLFKR